jgi:hypothetical protein
MLDDPGAGDVSQDGGLSRLHDGEVTVATGTVPAGLATRAAVFNVDKAAQGTARTPELHIRSPF